VTVFLLIYAVLVSVLAASVGIRVSRAARRWIRHRRVRRYLEQAEPGVGRC
jgi:hypothetical protein